ncbi:MAG: glycosyltransferase [Stellaceae bacterium]
MLQVTGALGMGGAETWLLELLRYWRNGGGVQSEFLLTHGNRDVFDDEARSLGAQLHYVRYGRGDLRGFAQRLRAILREGRFDAIHDHSDCAAGWHLLLGAGTLPSVRIVHVHNSRRLQLANYEISSSRRLTAAIGRRLVDNFATHVCGTSTAALGDYGFDAGSRRRPAVSVLHCGIAVSKFCGPREPDRQSVRHEFGWPPQVKIVLFAGRLDQALSYTDPRNHKNSWFAVNVVRAATGRDPSVRLLMAGAGSTRAEIERHIGCWGMSDKLRLIGLRTDMPRLMRAADVLLFPSAVEPLGMVAVEAQAAGLPVLASAAVPQEAVVVPELYAALPLEAPMERWIDGLLKASTGARLSNDLCRGALEASPFSIAASARRLEKIYAAGRS